MNSARGTPFRGEGGGGYALGERKRNHRQRRPVDRNQNYYAEKFTVVFGRPRPLLVVEADSLSRLNCITRTSSSLTAPEGALYNYLDPHHRRKLTRGGRHVRNPGV